MNTEISVQESETTNVIHSVLKLQDSINEAPEHRTNIELIPDFEHIPEGKPEDDNDLTSVVNNDIINADMSGTDKNICTNVGSMQLSINHPSGKTSHDNEVGNSKGNQMKSVPITHAPKDMDYRHKNSDRPILLTDTDIYRYRYIGIG